MTNINLKILNKDIVINIPKDESSWLIIKDETYRPDRELFVLNEFKNDFPHIDIGDNCSKIYGLCSRSVRLSSWLSSVNLKYSLIQNQPTFYRDHLSQDEFKIVSSDLTKISSLNQLKAAEELKAANEYKNKMELIQKKYSTKTFESKYSRIISMNTTELPLTLQLAIENYSPAFNVESPNTKAYARELLIRYKLELIKLLKEDQSLDIDKVIIDSQVK